MRKFYLFLLILLFMPVLVFSQERKSAALDTLRLNDYLIVLEDGTGDTTLSVQADKVGIGFSFPATKFHISQGSDFVGSAGFRLTTANTGHSFADGFGFFLDASDNVYIENRESGFMRFDVNLVERFRIDSNGNIIFNETGVDSDVIMEAVGVPSAFVLEGSSGNIGMGTAVPSEKLHIDEAEGTDGTGRWFSNASVSTTDATITTIYTLATITDRAYRLVANIIGAQDDGSNSMGATHSFTLKNVAGTVTEQGDASIQETDDSAGVSISGVVSGTNYLIQVTGIAAENWNWEISVDATIVAH